MSSQTILRLRGFERDMDGRRIFVKSFQAVDKGGSANILVGELEQQESHSTLRVALKVFPALLTDVTHELLRRELKICRKLDHPHILPFLGICENGPHTILVSLFMENGNLCKYLVDNPGADRNRLVSQVSNAVHYLHETAKIVHGDLKCENVLVSDWGDALLADFGLSTTREKAETEATTATAIRTQGTLRFLAPELLVGDASQTQGRTRSKTRESDVYAFGMLLLQAYTGKPPWYGMNHRAIILQIENEKTPPRPSVSFLNDLLWTICEACWGFEPNSRPHMRNIATMLRQNMKSSRGARDVPSSTGVLQSLYKVDFEQPYLPLLRQNSISSPLRILEHAEPVCTVAYTPDGSSIVSGCDDGMIRIWDIKSAEMIGKPMEGHTNAVLSVAISADAMSIASGSSDKTIRVWNVETRDTVALLKGHTDLVFSVAFSPDGSCIVSGSNDRTIRVWDLATSTTVVGPIRGHSDAVRSVTYSPNGARIVSGSADRMVCVWNAKTGLNVWRETLSAVWSVAFSADGKEIVAGCWDGSVHVLDADTGKIVLGPLQGHTEWVNSVAFSPDGKRIASGSLDRTVRLWDAETGDELHVMRGHDNEVYSVAIAPNAMHVASASEDRTVRIWDTSTTWGQWVGQVH